MKATKKSRKIKKLPASFRPLFWSYRFEDLNEIADKNLIIRHIVLYGTLDQWRWMMRHYDMRKIKTVLSRTPVSALRPSSVELIKTAFNINTLSHVRRVPHT